MIFPAMKTGKLTILTGAMARELITNADGKVTAVAYVDKASRTEKQVRCKAVVVAASACESARLLLNSKSARFSNGIANSSGQVGRNLTDTVGFSMSGFVPALTNLPRHNSDGIGGMHVYVPWWLYEDKKKDFPRGYHIEIGGGFGMPELGSFAGQCNRHEGYGKALKDKIREEYGAFVSFAGRGEMIPNKDSFCEIDPDKTDAWGIPVLRFHWGWSQHEINQVRHMENTFAAIIETLGGQVMSRRPEPQRAISMGGTIIHEAGTVRMGADPKTSVLNQYCQAHEVKNLFVCDAAPFVGNPDKNVTLSIVAFAWRASEYLAEEMRKGNV
jgi:choline dehydrogenase-like flavoprotein